MSVYTVHAPPQSAAPEPERFVFVRDGFHFWAFVFGPLWLLVKRLWLALLLYVVITAVLHFGLWLLSLPRSGHLLVSVLMHLLVGLEAATLQRWTFNRRRWTQLGVVTGVKPESTERRFFDSWVSRRIAPFGSSAPPQPPSPAARMAPASSEIIGLFPEPQSRP